MPSAVDIAKRALVKLLGTAAQKYKLKLELTRDSSAKDVSKAFKRVSLRAHPDKGGEQVEFQRLSAANDEWQVIAVGAADSLRRWDEMTSLTGARLASCTCNDSLCHLWPEGQAPQIWKRRLQQLCLKISSDSKNLF